MRDDPTGAAPGAAGGATSLTGPFLAALRNLARKEEGCDVDWINISDARRLAELGFASRCRQGWRISAAGQTALLGATEGGTPAAPSDAKVVRLFASS